MSVFADRSAGGAKPHKEPRDAGTLSLESASSEQPSSKSGLAEAELSGSVLAASDGSSAGEETDIEEMARVRLQHSHYRAIRRVDCSFAGGVLTLTGQVPTFHYKQLAQTALSGLPGVDQIINSIRVG